jgi:hypothetical protein
MTIIKSERKTSMLIPYEQRYIQTYHQNGHLIPEQKTGDPNSLLQLIIDTSYDSYHEKVDPRTPTTHAEQANPPTKTTDSTETMQANTNKN